MTKTEKLEKEVQEEQEKAKKSSSKRGKRGGSDKTKKLQSELDEAKIALEESSDKYLRLMADFENFKRNAIKQRQEITKTATKELVLPLIGVLDDIDRAKKAKEESGSEEGSLEGVELIFKKFRDILQNQGLKAMPAIGEAFDADLHEALCKVPSNDKDQAGKVIDEIEKGYYLNEVIIRHAKVVVGE
tara:strand:- start:744 stop:1307 length:564 start_codon:yes stop_codon:yes gene_type:complete